MAGFAIALGIRVGRRLRAFAADVPGGGGEDVTWDSSVTWDSGVNWS